MIVKRGNVKQQIVDVLVVTVLLVTLLPPATKLGQGYVFTHVCDSVHRGVLCPSMHHRSHDLGGSLSRGVSVWGVSVQGGFLSRGGGGFCPGGLCPGGSLSRGSLFGGISIWRGSLLGVGSLSRVVSVRETPPYGNTRAVRILPECILVYWICMFH